MEENTPPNTPTKSALQKAHDDVFEPSASVVKTLSFDTGVFTSKVEFSARVAELAKAVANNTAANNHAPNNPPPPPSE